jgi:uncharacterized membrane protein YphA (DoxX/SURF4 family)
MSDKQKRLLRLAVGVVFLVAGTGKALLPVLIPLVKPGLPTFGQILAALGVPLPVVTGYLVCAVEIGGGLALLTDRFVPLTCIVLIGDMLGALVSLSVPATFLGRPLQIGGLTLGNEPWRVPLELALLVALAALGRPWRLLRRQP